jgi:hypothetical protein
MTPFASEVGAVENRALQSPRLEQSLFGLFTRGVVGSDQQIADDGVLRVAQRGNRHNRREAAAVLADIGQLVDVLYPARCLEDQCFEARRYRGSELDAQSLGTRDHFLRIGDVRRRDLVHHVGGRVAQHTFRADVEDLNDAFRVGGDNREIGAGEDRVLQGPGFKQGLLVSDLGDALRRAGGGVETLGIADFFGHGRPLLKREFVWRIAQPKVRAAPHLLCLADLREGRAQAHQELVFSRHIVPAPSTHS